MRSFIVAATCLVTVCASAMGCAPEQAGAAQASANLEESPVAANKVRFCVGTEPFWGVSIDEDRITFDAFDTTTTIVNRGPIASPNTTAEFASLYQGPTLEDSAVTMSVIITRASDYCSDGMSDERYPFSVSVVRGGALFTGCCSARTE